MNGRAIPGAEMNTFRLTNVIPERIIFVCRGITVVPFISDVSTTWGCLIFPPLYPGAKSFRHPWNRMLFGRLNNIGEKYKLRQRFLCSFDFLQTLVKFKYIPPQFVL